MGFKFCFQCGSKFGYLYDFDMYMGNKVRADLDLGESVVVSLCQKLKNAHCCVIFDNFLLVQRWKFMQLGR